VVEVFIALNHHIAVGEAVCRRAHRTGRGATGHCSVHQPRHPTVRVRALSVGVSKPGGVPGPTSELSPRAPS
jgi:hypothetical protein